MKRIILLIFIMLLTYIIFINLGSYVLGMESVQNTFQNSQIQEGSEQKIGANFNVAVTVQKNRFYGEIIETSGNSKLYALSFIPLPLISNGFNFKFIHLIFTILISLLFIFLTILYYSNSERRLNHGSLDTSDSANNTFRNIY